MDDLDDDGVTLTEVICQPYVNMNISAGLVEGAANPEDTLYLRIARHSPPGKIGATELLLRPDEMQAIAWVANGALWALEIRRIDTQPDEDEWEADEREFGY